MSISEEAGTTCAIYAIPAREDFPHAIVSRMGRHEEGYKFGNYLVRSKNSARYSSRSCAASWASRCLERDYS